MTATSSAATSSAAMSSAARTRLVCRIFIKATPQAVWDAICPEPGQCSGSQPATGHDRGPGGARQGDHAAKARITDLITLGTLGEVLEADPPGRLVHAVGSRGRDLPAGPALLSFELRDTLTGYTALTISCGPDGPACGPDGRACGPAPITAGAREWDLLLGDLKAVLEASGRDGREPGRPIHRRFGSPGSGLIAPVRLRRHQPDGAQARPSGEAAVVLTGG